MTIEVQEVAGSTKRFHFMMDLKVGERVIPIDLVEDLTPQQYIEQLLTQQNGRPRKNEASFS